VAFSADVDPVVVEADEVGQGIVVDGPDVGFVVSAALR